jgi:hypothetical protein
MLFRPMLAVRADADAARMQPAKAGFSPLLQRLQPPGREAE